MNTKALILLSLAVFSWGNLSQACPCVDKQTLAINKTFHENAIKVENAVLSRLQNQNLINLVSDSLGEDQAKLIEIQNLSINNGIPYEYTSLSQGFNARTDAELNKLKGIPAGPALDQEYATFRASELQRLLTAFDTYFVLDVTTPALKAWVPQERGVIASNFSESDQIEAQVKGVKEIQD